MKTIRSEDGLALVAVLVLLVALSAIATGGFLVTTTELRVGDYHEEGVKAFQTVDAAMNEHLGRHRRGDDTVTYTYNAATASVGGELLLDIGDGNTLHRMGATATTAASRGGTANRELRVVAMLNDAQFRANAAITAGTGIHKNGSAGAIDGVDDSTFGDCSAGPQPDVAGVATGTAPNGYTQNGAKLVPSGSPAIDSTQTALQQIQDLNIPWQGIQNGSVLEPDYVIPGDSWPNFSTLDPDFWPVIRLTDPNAVLPGTGRGTIIADNNFTMNGNLTWRGILLVGGVMTSDGKQTIEGTAIVGLNALIPGQAPPPSSVGNGNKTFKYNSCWIRFAAQQFVGGLVPMPGTWTERM